VIRAGCIVLLEEEYFSGNVTIAAAAASATRVTVSVVLYVDFMAPRLTEMMLVQL